MQPVLTILASEFKSTKLTIHDSGPVEKVEVFLGAILPGHNVTLYGKSDSEIIGKLFLTYGKNVVYISDIDTGVYLHTFNAFADLKDNVITAVNFFIDMFVKKPKQETTEIKEESFNFERATEYLLCEAEFAALLEARFKLIKDDFERTPELIPLFTKLAYYHQPTTYDLVKLRETINELYKHKAALEAAMHRPDEQIN